jgi:hypothetical protein
VNGDAWRELAKGTMYRQGYLSRDTLLFLAPGERGSGRKVMPTNAAPAHASRARFGLQAERTCEGTTTRLAHTYGCGTMCLSRVPSEAQVT